MGSYVTPNILAAIYAKADLSSLPSANPAGGKPWVDPVTGAIIVGAANFSVPAHNHDDRYYTESETDALLATKQAAGSYAPAVHTHDDRYYTEAETDALLATKQAAGSYAAASHTHAASDIVSGTIATARLGSGTADATTYLRGDQTWGTIASGASWGGITGTLSSQTDLQSALDARLSLSGGTVTGQLEVDNAMIVTPYVNSVTTLLEINAEKNLVQQSILRFWGYQSSYLDLKQSHIPGTPGTALMSPFIRFVGVWNNAGSPVETSGAIAFEPTSAGGHGKLWLQPNHAGSPGICAWRHENRNPIFNVNSNLTTGQLNVEPNWTGKPGLHVRTLAGHTACPIQVHNSSNVEEFCVKPGGELQFTGPLRVGVYTFATLPTASARPGEVLRISDRGQKHAYSDGTNWLFVHDNSVVS